MDAPLTLLQPVYERLDKKSRLKRLSTHYVEMALISASDARSHRSDSSASSFSQSWIRERFGRDGFAQINDRLGWFSVSDYWVIGDASDGETKKYWLTGPGHVAINESFQSEFQASSAPIRHSSPRHAIASTDNLGYRVKRWPRARLRKMLPVDAATITAELGSIVSVIALDSLDDKDRGMPRLDPKSLQQIIARRSQLQMLALCCDRSKHSGWTIEQTYTEYESGRLYSQGLNLQTVRSEFKRAALFGSWEYDFSNCHFQILRNMGESYGYYSRFIDDYCEHNQQIRRTLSHELEVDIADIKKCLIALIYVARVTGARSTAIGKILGPDKASALFHNTTVAGLIEDIQETKNLLLSNARQLSSGEIQNIAGKLLRSRRPSRNQKIAHLLQGAESAFLETVITPIAEHIMLLQHDGFTCDQEIDLDQARRDMRSRFGFSLELEFERFQQHIIADYSELGYVNLLVREID